jgi:hypothetical protein
MSSVRPTPQGPTGAAGYEDYADQDRGYGWVSFAGVLLVILGTLNVIEGIAAIGNARFFVGGQHYIFANLKTWGWIVLCLGALQLAVGLGVFVKNQLARWAGVVVLGANAIAQMLMIPAYPFWSLALFTVNIVAIYGLVAYGQRIGRA